LACELLVCFYNITCNEFLYFVNKTDKELLGRVKNFTLGSDFNKSKVVPFVPKARLILKHVKSFGSLKHLDFKSSYDWQAWLDYLSKLEQAFDSKFR